MCQTYSMKAFKILSLPLLLAGSFILPHILLLSYIVLAQTANLQG